jgi:predicted transglutaminase-like cysteine proteinase
MTATEAKTVVTNRDDNAELLPANEFRKKLIITNTAGAVKYIKLTDTGAVSAAVAEHDFVLAIKETAGATFVLDNYTGAVKASAATVTYVELG